VKKFLSLLLFFTFAIFLNGCNDFKDIDDIDVDGTELSVNQFDYYLNEYEEFNNENQTQLDNKWYDVDIEILEENYKDEDNYTKTKIVAKGKVYLSKFTYENKFKLDIEYVTETKSKSDDKDSKVEIERTEKDIEYIQINGRKYCKEKVKYEADGEEGKATNYSMSPNSIVNQVMNYILTDVSSKVFGMNIDYVSLKYESDFYKIKNGFALELEKEDEEKYQLTFTTLKDSYQVKKAKAYIEKESEYMP